jgi:amino acid transporter
MSSSASELGSDDDPQFFADGARWDIAVVIAVAAILAGAVFGWQGTAVVLAVPVGLMLIAAATFVFIALVMRSVAKSAGDELEESGEDE